MNSQSFCDLIDDYVDDDLFAEQKTQFESHLDSCPACQDNLARVREIDSLLTKAWQSVDLGVEPAVVESTARGAVPLTSAQINQSSFVSMVATLAAILLLTFGISRIFDATNEDGHADSTPEELVAVNTPDAGQQATSVDNDAAGSGYQISYASATFDSSTTGHKIATNEEFTVYQVVPKVTYSITN